MKRTRMGLVAVVSALLLLAIEPAAAQSVNKDLIGNLNLRLLYVAIPITVFVEVILIYTVYRFRDNDDPTPTQENRRLEITWTVATAIILLFVGIAAFTVLGNPYVSLTKADVGSGGTGQANPTAPQPEVVNQSLPGAVAPPAGSDAVQIDVLGYQWGWDFAYVADNFTSRGKIVVPTNKDVYLHIHSEHVLHAVHVPKLDLKQDAFPGKYNTIKTNVTKAGTYQLYCAEYCGSGHSHMLANFTAMNQSNYQNWVNQQQSDNSTNSTNSTNNTNSSGSGNATNASNGSSNASTTANSQRIAPPAALSSTAP